MYDLEVISCNNLVIMFTMKLTAIIFHEILTAAYLLFYSSLHKPIIQAIVVPWRNKISVIFNKLIKTSICDER